MELSYLFLILLCVSILCNLFQIHKIRKAEEILYHGNLQIDLQLKEIERLKSLSTPEKKVLSIEAQQILHDMTAHGNAIIRIIPLNPNEIFYRSPQG